MNRIFSYDFLKLEFRDLYEDIEELHRQTDKILFDIEKEVRSKFKNRNSWYFS